GVVVVAVVVVVVGAVVVVCVCVRVCVRVCVSMCVCVCVCVCVSILPVCVFTSLFWLTAVCVCEGGGVKLGWNAVSPSLSLNISPPLPLFSPSLSLNISPPLPLFSLSLQPIPPLLVSQ